jgi:hypothetical protein
MTEEQQNEERSEAELERETFWQSIVIPINENWKADKTDFANPVEVADMFARATGMSTTLSTEAERLTEDIANYEYIRDEAQLELTKLRRRILSENIAALKASWGSEVVEAFILSSAGNQTESLLGLEKDVEEAARQIRLRKPSLERLKKRLVALEVHMEWAKEWLNFDKLMQRITEGRRRV